MSEKTFILGKDAALEESIQKFQQKLTALNFNIEEASWLNPVPNVWSVHIRDKDCPLCFSNGKGATKKAALASALGEYFERLSTNYFFADFYLGKKIANSDFVHYPNEKWFPIVDDDTLPEGLLNEELLNYYDPNQELTPEQLIDLQSGNYERGIVAMPYVQQSTQQTVYIPQSIIANLYVSNGMSAGNTKYEARVQGLSEVFERYVKNKIIAEAISLPEIPENVLSRYPSIQASIQKLEEEGFPIIAYDASLGGKYPVICVILLNPNNGTCFASFGAHPHFQVALERTVTELLQGRNLKDLDVFTAPSFNNDDVADLANLETHFIDSSGLISWDLFKQTADFEFVDWNFSAPSTQQEYDNLMAIFKADPAAAVLMGIGYWLDPDGWGGNSQLAALLIKSGAAIIDNMAILFAVGVAFGMSKDKHGSAALSGLVGYLVVTTLLSPGAVAQLESIPADQVPAAFGKINNQFIGILIGVISAELYNRFYQVELPKALAFFSGKRLVPIVVSVVMIIVSFILLYIWPAIFNALVGFGENIKDLGATGAGIYAFFNRLLIPVGLHHALNSVFWFDVAGINDIPNFLGGAKSLAEGTATPGVTGMYQAGFFPVMMFGLPAAALAIYHSAKPAKKAQVASIMIAAALASFFTGITEPLEFSFMFVAPVLYVIHALLTGVSVFIAATMHWIAGFGFSAGLVDMVLSSRNPLAVQWYMLLLQGLVFAVIYYLVFRAVIKALNLKTPGREDEQSETTIETKDISRRERAEGFVEALGGKDNLVTIDACITRLRLTLDDRSKIDEAKLKALGSKGNVKLGENNLQVILGPEAELIADTMKQL